MIYCNYLKWIVRDYDLNREIVEFNKFFNRIIDRFELSKSQNVTFHTSASRNAVIL